jgi:hypothetical protein
VLAALDFNRGYESARTDFDAGYENATELAFAKTRCEDATTELAEIYLDLAKQFERDLGFEQLTKSI